ncbi:hypothetical protein PBI_GAIA_162 [Mycobacterium phage Gaia]|uniref:Uncharacterized protein n=1 Tax=Mycobacterium phage Gaia TaxID=1486472 RepID=A0A068F3P8_9CAUD|nr:hypothetical protein VC46_gp074 [Mycobacterium phage Gaia]AID58978.1 hypothetical protein PBI_GAIA_162 [Mycobacterium phage Gaia]AYR00117.1 hypothetical protein PBI_NEBKISS_158 [Mycobacterium phage Nebkiss]
MTTFTCTDCGISVDPLEIFPKNRCLNCHASSPETIRELRAMTGERLAQMWGGR